MPPPWGNHRTGPESRNPGLIRPPPSHIQRIKGDTEMLKISFKNAHSDEIETRETELLDLL